jgi:tRNA (adenine37-N6)-methyltransferase
VYDIKPYLPYCESIPEAQAGFAPSAPAAVAIQWNCSASHLTAQEQQLIEQSLAQLPLPAYLSPSQRQHSARLGAWEVHFTHEEDGVHICQLLQPQP